LATMSRMRPGKNVDGEYLEFSRDTSLTPGIEIPRPLKPER
jgi:hypothetical protein